MTDNMVTTVGQHPEYTLEKINAQFHAELPNKLPISNSTMAKVLKGQLVVLKKMETVQQDRNCEDVRPPPARRKCGAWLLN